MEGFFSVLFDLKAAIMSAIISFILYLIREKLTRNIIKNNRSKSTFEFLREHDFVYAGVKIIFWFIIAYIFTASVIYFATNKGKDVLAVEKLREATNWVVNIRADFEGLDHDDPYYSKLSPSQNRILLEIMEKAPRLANELENIPDENLNIGNQLFKYDNISYILAIASECERNMETKKKLINRGLNAVDLAFSLIDKINIKARGELEGYYYDLQKWMKNEDTIDRLHTVKAWLFAIEAKSDKKIEDGERKRVQEELSKISTYYKENNRHLFKRNPSLRFFSNEE